MGSITVQIFLGLGGILPNNDFHVNILVLCWGWKSLAGGSIVVWQAFKLVFPFHILVGPLYDTLSFHRDFLKSHNDVCCGATCFTLYCHPREVSPCLEHNRFSMHITRGVGLLSTYQQKQHTGVHRLQYLPTSTLLII